jgi:hypothetical protein
MKKRKTKKQVKEYAEGSKARNVFEDTMQRLFRVRKGDLKKGKA